MKYIIYIIVLSILFCQNNCKQNNMNYNKLTPEEEKVIIYKGTEKPFTGKYNDFWEEGVYTCKRCDAPLFRSSDKFNAGCGWPSFDDEITGAVKRIPDADGQRIEILCANCGAHLGHVFAGEGFTPKNIRHCVNSISLNFVKNKKDVNLDTAIFASGCFWGTEYYFQQAKGVISTTVGFTGGKTENPTYKKVCMGLTGHAEAVKIVFDKDETSYDDLVKLFFETHDPTQVNRQGPDIGEQYRSVIFYNSEEQKQTAEKYKKLLEEQGYKIATTIEKAGTFWDAEEYHQDYYIKNGGTPHCHRYTKRF